MDVLLVNVTLDIPLGYHVIPLLVNVVVCQELLEKNVTIVRTEMC